MENNKDKLKHGMNGQKSLEEYLRLCKGNGLIKEYKSNYRVGRQEYDKNQFYAQFLVIFFKNEKWALYFTTSARTDRIKGQQWDSFNLKEIDDSITKCYLVLPDDLSDTETKIYRGVREKYLNHQIFSYIDGIVQQEELYHLIEEKGSEALDFGQLHDFKGNVFEKRIADILSNADNFSKWKDSDPLLVGTGYKTFLQIISYLCIAKEKVKKITATSDRTKIGKLESGGNPKTDILIKVMMDNGLEDVITMSCKRTSSKSVSVHQYSADAFSHVLDSNNEELKRLLQEFQRVGNLRDFGPDNIDALTKALIPYRGRLAAWVLGGDGGYGDPQTQGARYLLTYNDRTGEYKIHTTAEYALLLRLENIEGNFGTGFSWTFASKQKGKSIQLKTKIL